MSDAVTNDERGAILLRIARYSLEEAFGGQGVSSSGHERESWLGDPGATFVTLALAEQLRGCIGTLEAYRSLLEDVQDNTRAAAFRDARFPPLERSEMDNIRLEVSLLSPLEAVSFETEAELLRALRPGVDGVLLEYRGDRGTFLPQVWDRVSEPRLFLAFLKEKAGLKRDFWDPDIQVLRYTVSKWGEEAPGSAG